MITGYGLEIEKELKARKKKRPLEGSNDMPCRLRMTDDQLRITSEFEPNVYS
jgi:hypothetical protein